MATKLKLYPAHEVLIKIAKQHMVFVKAFSDTDLGIDSWQVVALLAHTISHIHIPTDKRHDVVNAMFDAWDKSTAEHNMSVQAFRPFVLNLLDLTSGHNKSKQLLVPAHVFLLNLIDYESLAYQSYRRALRKLALSRYDYHLVIKFSLICLSRMVIPKDIKEELLRKNAARIMSLKDRAKIFFPYNSQQRGQILMDLYYLLVQLLFNQAGVKRAKQIAQGMDSPQASRLLNDYIGYQLAINRACRTRQV